MKIVILTSEGHIMANYLIKHLLVYFSQDNEFYVFESDKLLAGHTLVNALKKYIKTSGMYYVINQILKVYISKLIWQIGRCFKIKDIQSSFTYWRYMKADNMKRDIVENIKSEKSIKHIETIKPDIILSLLFNQIIPETIFSIPRFGTYNVHPAMLPEYKGVSPTFWVIADGCQESGVTIHCVVKKIDEGKIVAQEKVEIKTTDSEHSLYAKSTVLASGMLGNLLTNLKNGIDLPSIPKKTEGFYRSLPTKQAVAIFRKNKRKLFRFRELFSNFKKFNK